MTFKENALGKLGALSKAALGLVIFVCLEYAVFSAFAYCNVDMQVYRGAYNFAVSAVTIAMMLIIHKISSRPGDPLIKLKKVKLPAAPAQVLADGREIACLRLDQGQTENTAPLKDDVTGKHAVYFVFRTGNAKAEFNRFTFDG